MAAFTRFLCVGLMNSAVGYAIIFIGLRRGWGDYAANAAGYAIGLSVSYFLQRRWAFAVKAAVSIPELLRFGGAALAAYGVNLSIIFLARRAGHVNNPVFHAGAMMAYSITFFMISRHFVFSSQNDSERRL